LFDAPIFHNYRRAMMENPELLQRMGQSSIPAKDLGLLRRSLQDVGAKTTICDALLQR
jgi:hypothetical protein